MNKKNTISIFSKQLNNEQIFIAEKVPSRVNTLSSDQKYVFREFVDDRCIRRYSQITQSHHRDWTILFGIRTSLANNFLDFYQYKSRSLERPSHFELEIPMAWDTVQQVDSTYIQQMPYIHDYHYLHQLLVELLEYLYMLTSLHQSHLSNWRHMRWKMFLSQDYKVQRNTELGRIHRQEHIPWYMQSE